MSYIPWFMPWQYFSPFADRFPVMDADEQGVGVYFNAWLEIPPRRTVDIDYIKARDYWNWCDEGDRVAVEVQFPGQSLVRARALFNEAVLFTNRRIGVFRDGAWACVRYADIKECRVLGEKLLADGLNLETAAGTVFVPIRGGGERSRDVFEAMRFVGRAIEYPSGTG